MQPLPLVAVLLCLASIFGFLNYRLLGFPSAIGQMMVALVASLILVGLDRLWPGLDLRGRSQDVLGTRDLPNTLLNGALAFLLFAGSLQVDIAALWHRKLTVLLLATIGVILATGLFGLGIWLVFRLVGAPTPLSWCFVLGAVLAPTDPVAVTEMLSRVGLPKSLQAVMAGESLFNDGVGVLVFGLALSVALTHGPVSPGPVLIEGLRQAGGAVVVGGLGGWLGHQLMRRIEDYPLKIMISLALASSVYALADAIGSSGPIAVVVAGLLTAAKGRPHAMNRPIDNLSLVWTVIEEILNALLFLLLGFELLGLHFARSAILAAAIAIPLALVVRAASILAPIFWLHARNPERWPGVAILTWGGLRGGISVALALSLPQVPWRDSFLVVCYSVVLFTILVQGLTIERVAGALYRRS